MGEEEAVWQEVGKAGSHRPLTFCVQEFGSNLKNGNDWEVSNRDANYEGLKLESSVCCSKDETVLWRREKRGIFVIPVPLDHCLNRLCPLIGLSIGQCFCCCNKIVEQIDLKRRAG